MGSDLSKCICAPAPKLTSSDISKRRRGDNKKRSLGSESCTDGELSTSESEDNSDDNEEDEDEEEESSSSQHTESDGEDSEQEYSAPAKSKKRNRKPRTRTKHAPRDRKHTKHTSSTKKAQKSHQTNKNRSKHKQHDSDTDSQSSSLATSPTTSSSDESSRRDAHIDTGRHAMHAPAAHPEIAHYASHDSGSVASSRHSYRSQRSNQSVPQRGSNMVDRKRRQKEEDRRRRKLEIIGQSMVDRKPRHSVASNPVFYEQPHTTNSQRLPLRMTQSNQYVFHSNNTTQQYYDNQPPLDHDAYSQYSDQDAASVHSLPHRLNYHRQETEKRHGQHPRIPSMTDFDPQAMRLLASESNVRSLFDPQLRSTSGNGAATVNPLRNMRVNVFAANNNNNSGTLSQPLSPRDNIPPFFQGALTPNTHQFYSANQHHHNNYDNAYGHAVSHSVDLSSFPNTTTRRRNSNPTPDLRGSFEIMVPQQRHAQPNIVDDHHFEEDDLPAMPIQATDRSASVPNFHQVRQSPQAPFVITAPPIRTTVDTNNAELEALFDANTVIEHPEFDHHTDIADTMDKLPEYTEITIHLNQIPHRSNSQDSEGKEGAVSTSFHGNISPKPTTTSQQTANATAVHANSHDITSSFSVLAASSSQLTYNNVTNVETNASPNQRQPNRIVPPSPPVHAVYKPPPTTSMGPTLSHITESSNETNHASCPENELMITVSSESNQFATLNELPPAKPAHELQYIEEVVSSPEVADDDDTVANQWKELHDLHMDHKRIPTAPPVNMMLSMQTDLSSDQDEANEEVNAWKKHNTEKNGTTTSSDEEMTQTELLEAETPKQGHRPSLIRKTSMHKWKTVELNTEAHEMARQLQHMQDIEQEAIKNQLAELKQQNKPKWIEQ